MAEFVLSYTLIPDGISTIVQVEIKGEFYVPTINADKEAQEGAASLIARLTGSDKAQIQEQIQAHRSLGEGWRPDEPAGGDE